MKSISKLHTGFAIIAFFGISQLLSAIPHPPRPSIEATQLQNARIVVLDQDNDELEVEISGEVKLGENACLAKGFEAFLSVSRKHAHVQPLVAYLVDNKVSHRNCGNESDPQIVTIRKKLWLNSNIALVMIGDTPAARIEFPVRGVISETKTIDIEKIAETSEGKSLFRIDAKIWVGSNSCQAENHAGFFEVTRRASDNSVVLTPKHQFLGTDTNKDCTAQYQPVWKQISVVVEADDLLDIVVTNRSAENFEYDQI